MRAIKALLAFIVLLFLGSIVRAEDMPDAKAELSAAIRLLKAQHINSSKLDWPAVQAKAFGMLGAAAKPEEAYPVIRYIIAELGERHTRLIPADAFKVLVSGAAAGNIQPPDWQPPEGHLLEGGIGLVELKDYPGSADDLGYAGGARTALRSFADRHVCRYIVDLRSNGGGNMYPMINGLEALLGKPPYGFWQDVRDTQDRPWLLKTGAFEHEPVATDETAQSRAPVAVLIGRRTGSSGEYTAMAFKGRPNTRFFGENSAGLLTFNTPGALPDGARIMISGGWGTDRLHHSYRDVIAPDQATPRGPATLDAAIAWLKQQPCRR